jgi:aarF domain-containing kinase
MAVDAPERPTSAPQSMADISREIASARARMMEDDQSRLMMQALRGTNINDNIAADEGVSMDVVEMRASSGADDTLPLLFEPERLKAYFSKRPMAVFTRVAQIASKSSALAIGVAWDWATGNKEDIEVRRAADLRRTIISLGPFFIKLGQALSIRPDVLSPRAMVELQQLCDKVPSFDNALAMRTVREELGVSAVSDVFSEITPAPVAAASLGQVYKATLRESGDIVAVKVQRPYVLETVSLDLHLARELGLLFRRFPALSRRLDLVALLDEFGSRFYAELDYEVECANGERIRREMASMPQIVIPRNYPKFTTRRVHVAEWVDGEKLSQSTAGDVGALVNLGVIAYLSQLLDSGFFHADPHPGARHCCVCVCVLSVCVGVCVCVGVSGFF